ncbi:olfactomedin-like protein 2B [Acropora millepora]|uniref:olfactomedin-like protein 2B n=1 Tax=Acropora millepora TaxID=45264 RepID=UPI001CF0FF87|nr:olfactomedin-like protein 2B [Acropora millepora]XP_044177226.1 olfactomedin-like protein 2B [Acropora millepora]
MCRYRPLICLLVALLTVDALGNSSMKSRSRRAVISNTSKLSFKDLALELAKIHLLKTIAGEQHDLQKAKESLNILQRDKCSNIKTIGKPVVHNSRVQSQGSWMKDPLEIMGAETIFVMEYYSGNELEEYENMNKFKAGLIRKKFKLPYSWDGTGAVVYGQHLYYNRASTYYIVKYNLLTGGVEAQITASSYNTRKQYYQWGGYSGMDLAVDEQGLWVIAGQSSSSYPLYLGKIDVVKNSIPLGWNLRTKNMKALGNAFVACGVIYAIDNYSSRSTTINFAYDTKTGKQWNPNIQFTNQFGYNSMVDYNPREKVLYSWDNKRLVTYLITFEEE